MSGFSQAGERLRQSLAALDPGSPKYATEAVDRMLSEAQALGASDIHLLPAQEGLEVRWRLDGVLHLTAVLPKAIAPNVVARLKVLADLLTYRTDVPQEGRIRNPSLQQTANANAKANAKETAELRVSTFPSLHGEKAVVRIFGTAEHHQTLSDLGFAPETELETRRWLQETSGMMVFAGPAGAGKTTSLYACLRELTILTEGQRGLATLEDPIEVAVPGVSQSQVHPAAGFDLETGLRSLLRQDPEVIGIGEIRDRSVAQVAFQAALTGHLILTTFHAGSAAAALSRLADMGVEPYVLRGGLLAIICQRLVRRLCPHCAQVTDDPDVLLGLPVAKAKVPKPGGCPECRGAGHRGRMVIEELLLPRHERVARAILAKADLTAIESAAKQDGMIDRWSRAHAAVRSGVVSPTEIRRVFGFG